MSTIHVISSAKTRQHLGLEFGTRYRMDHEFSKFSAFKYWSETKRQEKLKEKQERIVLFGEILKETGNLEYARKEAGLSAAKAEFYMHFLNATAADRGLPPLFTPKPKDKNLCNAKLCAEQVKYIKYLITKYSLKKVAAMYGVSASTMNLIRNGMIWKDVKPAIVNENPVLWINQYLCIK